MISLEQLVGKGLSEWLIIKLIVYNMSWMVILAVPMGVLFSSLMAFGSMSMAHEVTIVKASGGSLIRMMMPVIVAAFGLYIGLFLFNDIILPESNHQVKIMMNDIQRKKPSFALEKGLFSTQLDGYTILSRNVDSISGVLSGVTIYDMTRFQNRNIISADSGWISFTPDYKKLVLDLKDGEVHQFAVNFVDNYKIIRFTDYRIAMSAYGFAFEQSNADMVSKGDREMNVADMTTIVDTAESNKRNIFKKIDSSISKSINDFIAGHTKITPDTIKSLKTSNIDSTLAIKPDTTKSVNKNNIAEKKKLIVPKLTKKDDLETKEIKKTEKKEDKSKDSGLTYLEIVNQKFKKAIKEGNSDINRENVVDDINNQKNIKKALDEEKKKFDEDSAKTALIKIAVDKKTGNSEPAKRNKVKKEVTNLIPDVVEQKNVKSSISFDTTYPEVLNRILQQTNLIKSTIQTDINNLKFFDSRSEQYQVEIYKKYAIPFACLIFVFVGAPLGVITKGGNFGISAGISLAFYIFYWACLIGGEKLADRGILAPWLAMWMANIIVGIIGILLTLRVSNESIKFSFVKKSSKKISEPI
jgi:lipopolysaccharide export LptBFGC system permease protein LptF